MLPPSLRPRLIHTMLHVADMDRALAFYRDMLGMALVVARGNAATGHRNIFLRFPGADGTGAGAELELTSYRDRPHYDHGDAFGHIALGVDDCRATCAALREHGVALLREPRDMPSGAVIAFITDPDGYALEIVQAAPVARP